MIIGEIAIQSGIALATGASITGAIVILKKKCKKKKQMTREQFQRNAELFQSFKYREAFRIQRFTETEMEIKLKLAPKSEKVLIEKYSSSDLDDFESIKKDFQCPISGSFMTDPVTLNGLVYDREFVEDWIFENDWTDPGIQNSQSNTVSPDDIQECAEEYLQIF